MKSGFVRFLGLQIMKKFIVAILLNAFLLPSIQGQQPQEKQENKVRENSSQPSQAQRMTEGNFIVPGDINVHIESDVRMFVVMAAINVAGFDYEPGRQPLTPVRVELRKDLAEKVDPHTKAKLAAYYQSHRRAGVDEGVDATRYAALSLLMTQPPSFSIYEHENHKVPEDLRPLLTFIPLVQEFYIKSNIKEVARKYMVFSEAYAAAYRRPVGAMIYQILEYFHLRPETIVNMKSLIISSGEPGSKVKKEREIARTRSRQVFIIPDPLSSAGSSIARADFLNQKDDLLARRVGDDYLVSVGPLSNLEAVRNTLIRFVLDPLIERKLKATIEYKDALLKLVKAVPTSSREYHGSVYQIVRESLARAAEARFRRLQAIETRGNYSEDEAITDLAQAYLRGAVLAFHFYESLTALEKVGIGIEDFYDQMLATIKFDREEKRALEFEPIVARVSVARKNAAEAGKTETAGDPFVGTLTKKILDADDLIRQNRFVEARAMLEEVLAAEPKNARALYGMGRIFSQSQSKVEADPGSDENDKIQAQHERFKMAMNYYRKVVENASLDSEKWMIQWSHVLIGRILDFQEFRQDAINEYEKAIALGDKIPNGAYKEAVEGKLKPYGQKVP
jgi:tetratricopeptide (TPR) repeat protein